MGIFNNKEYELIDEVWYSKDKNGKKYKITSEKLIEKLSKLPSAGLGDRKNKTNLIYC